MRFLGNAIPWGSGYRKDVIVKYQKSTSGGLVAIGGTLDTSRTSTRIKIQFKPSRRHIPVVIDDLETTLNEGDAQVLQLIATEMDSVAQDLLDSFGDDLYTGTGTGTQFDSLLTACDDGTNYSSYGGQSRTTYATLKGELDTSIGSLALSDMSTLWKEVKIGHDNPNLGLADPTSWDAYEGLLLPTVRAGYSTNGYPQVTKQGTQPSKQALGGEIGFGSIYYRGMPVVEDEKCDSGYFYMVNDKYFGFHSINLKNYQTINLSDRNVEGPQATAIAKGFNWSGLLRATNQPAEVGHIYICGDFISKNPRTGGSMQGITG